MDAELSYLIELFKQMTPQQQEEFMREIALLLIIPSQLANCDPDGCL